MSKASATGQIIVTSNGTTLHTILQCTTGDVYQNYDGEWDSSSVVISPNFEISGATKPVIVMQAYSAEQGAGNSFNLSKGNASWFVGDTQLTFADSNGVSTSKFNGQSGHFTKGTDKSGNPTLTVNKNLIAVNSGDSFNISCKTSISVNNTNVVLQAVYPVYIAQGAVDSKRATIMATDTNKLFTIDTKGGSCRVRCAVTDGNAMSYEADGRTFKWYLPDTSQSSGWKEKQNSTSSYFTVNEADVESSTVVKCEVYNNNSFFASDVQTINDVSDEYIVSPNPTDGTSATSENFIKNSGSKIVYKPYVRKRGSTSNETNVSFEMSLYSSAGVNISSLVTKSGSGTSTSFTITEANLRDYNGANYMITATIS